MTTIHKCSEGLNFSILDATGEKCAAWWLEFCPKLSRLRAYDKQYSERRDLIGPPFHCRKITNAPSDSNAELSHLIG